MLKRKIEQTLLEWKNTANRKPLIVKGCRQCGKTFSVLDFAHKNYKNVVYLNFFENPDYASVFAGSLEVDNIVMMLWGALRFLKLGKLCWSWMKFRIAQRQEPP